MLLRLQFEGNEILRGTRATHDLEDLVEHLCPCLPTQLEKPRLFWILTLAPIEMRNSTHFA